MVCGQGNVLLYSVYKQPIFVQIEEDGEATYGAWEDCAEGCPGMQTAGHSCSLIDHGVLFLLCFNIFVVKFICN